MTWFRATNRWDALKEAIKALESIANSTTRHYSGEYTSSWEYALTNEARISIAKDINELATLELSRE